MLLAWALWLMTSLNQTAMNRIQIKGYSTDLRGVQFSVPDGHLIHTVKFFEAVNVYEASAGRS